MRRRCRSCSRGNLVSKSCRIEPSQILSGAVGIVGDGVPTRSVTIEALESPPVQRHSREERIGVLWSYLDRWIKFLAMHWNAIETGLSTPKNYSLGYFPIPRFSRWHFRTRSCALFGVGATEIQVAIEVSKAQAVSSQWTVAVASAFLLRVLGVPTVAVPAT